MHALRGLEISRTPQGFQLVFGPRSQRWRRKRSDFLSEWPLGVSRGAHQGSCTSGWYFCTLSPPESHVPGPSELPSSFQKYFLNSTWL